MLDTHSRSRNCLRYADTSSSDDCAYRFKVLESMGFARLSRGRWSYEGKVLFVSKVRRGFLRPRLPLFMVQSLETKAGMRCRMLGKTSTCLFCISHLTLTVFQHETSNVIALWLG